MAQHALGQAWLSWELITALSAHKNSGFAKGQCSFLSLQRTLFKVRSGWIIWQFSIEEHLLILWICFANGLLKTTLFFFWHSIAARYNPFAFSRAVSRPSVFLLKLHGKHTSLMLWGCKFISTNADFAVEDSLSKLFPPTLMSNALQAFCAILLRFPFLKLTMKFPNLKFSEFCCSSSFWTPYSEHEVNKSCRDEILQNNFRFADR